MEPITLADVFKSDLFRTTTMTAAVNEIAYVPTRLAELGIFHVEGISTTSAFIEKVGDTLVLVQSTARGGPGVSVTIDKRNAIAFESVRLSLDDALLPDSIQNVRAFGGTQLQGVQEVRDGRLGRMSRSIDLTLEYHRLGAVQGLILDADGSVIDDLYDKFGISEPAAVPLNLDVAFSTVTEQAVVKPIITDVLRAIDAELGGISPSGYWAPCGDDFFDALESHGELRHTLQAQEARGLREDGRRSFTYGGVTWENYRGTGSVALAATEARIIPLGVPELFQQLFAPADTFEAVNTNGQVKYAMATMASNNKKIDLEVQSNPITLCTRPKVLRKLTLT